MQLDEQQKAIADTEEDRLLNNRLANLLNIAKRNVVQMVLLT